MACSSGGFVSGLLGEGASRLLLPGATYVGVACVLWRFRCVISYRELEVHNASPYVLGNIPMGKSRSTTW